jgi:neutral amino acid transport system permease protein
MRFTQSSMLLAGSTGAHKATVHPQRLHRRNAFLGFIFAVAVVFLSLAGGLTSAHADEVGSEYNFTFSGNVKYQGTALEGVRITVEGKGYDAETVTDAEGKWKIGVPEKAVYTVALDESTLPSGVIVAEGTPTVEAEFGLSSAKSVNFFLGEGERVVVSFTDQLVARFFDGINFGLMLALAAIGVSLVFGTTGLSNFAQAEMVTFGALAALFFSTAAGISIWIALPLAVVASGAFGWSLDAGIWKPLRKKGVGLVQMMIVSIGLSLALRYVFLFFAGGATQQLEGAGDSKIPIIGPVSLAVSDMISMGISIVVLAGVGWWLLRTRIGKATRAISDNPSLAAASGIDVDGVIRIVWILSGALAGLAGILWAYFRPGIKWDMGGQILLLIFAAVTLGGLGTAFGALVGSIIVGVMVEVSSLFVPSDLKYIGALLVLILVLLVRPQGILGRKERIG